MADHKTSQAIIQFFINKHIAVFQIPVSNAILRNSIVEFYKITVPFFNKKLKKIKETYYYFLTLTFGLFPIFANRINVD